MKIIVVLLIAVCGLSQGKFLDEEFYPSRDFLTIEEDYQDKRKVDPVVVDNSVKSLYNDMSSSHKNKYAILKIEDGKVVIESLGEGVQTSTEAEDKKQYDKMLKSLPSDEPRFILYDFSFKSVARDNKEIKKLVLILWVSPVAGWDLKKAYEFNKNNVKNALNKRLTVFMFSKLEYMTFPKLVQRVQWMV